MANKAASDILDIYDLSKPYVGVRLWDQHFLTKKTLSEKAAHHKLGEIGVTGEIDADSHVRRLQVIMTDVKEKLNAFARLYMKQMVVDYVNDVMKVRDRGNNKASIYADVCRMGKEMDVDEEEKFLKDALYSPFPVGHAEAGWILKVEDAFLDKYNIKYKTASNKLKPTVQSLINVAKDSIRKNPRTNFHKRTGRMIKMRQDSESVASSKEKRRMEEPKTLVYELPPPMSRVEPITLPDGRKMVHYVSLLALCVFCIWTDSEG